MPKSLTVYDVAKRAGTSIATVLRVLRRPDEVREQTRELVHAAIRELGYVPSGSARGLAARQTGVLGLCFPDVDGIDDPADLPSPVRVGETVQVVRDTGQCAVHPGNLYMGEVMRGAELEAWRTGLAVMIAVARGAQRSVMVSELAGRVDGLAVLSATVPDDVLAHIARRIPVVVMAERRIEGAAHDHVSVDIAALAQAGLPVPGEPALRGDFTREAARGLARQMLAPGPLPRALVCSNDQTALGFLDELTAAGVSVPGQVVLTGFDAARRVIAEQTDVRPEALRGLIR